MQGAANGLAIFVTNLLTLFRFVSAPLIPAAIYFQFNPLYHIWDGDYKSGVLALSIGAGASDFLDGYIAKHYGGATRFGEIFDPIADKCFSAGLAFAVPFYYGWGWYFGAYALPMLCLLHDGCVTSWLRFVGRIGKASDSAKMKTFVLMVSQISFLIWINVGDRVDAGSQSNLFILSMVGIVWAAVLSRQSTANYEQSARRKTRTIQTA